MHRPAASPPRSAQAGTCYSRDLFVVSPSRELGCCVCGGIARDAVSSKKCSHTFGMQCILQHLMETEECPVCHVPMDCSDIAPSERLRRQLAVHSVQCTEDACSWRGPITDFLSHKNGPQCGNHLVSCPFCEKRVRSGTEFEAHKASCPQGPVLCPQCEEYMARNQVDAHARVCAGIPKFPVRKRESRGSATTTVPSSAPSCSSTVPAEEQRAVPPVPAASPGKSAPRPPNSDSPSPLKQEDDKAAPLPALRTHSSEVPEEEHLHSVRVSEATTDPHDVARELGEDEVVDEVGSVDLRRNGTSVPAGGENSTGKRPAAPTQQSVSPQAANVKCVHGASACPFGVMGCTLPLPHGADDPASLQTHLQLICAAYVALTQRCDALSHEVSTLRRQLDVQGTTACNQSARTPRQKKAAAENSTPAPFVVPTRAFEKQRTPNNRTPGSAVKRTRMFVPCQPCPTTGSPGTRKNPHRHGAAPHRTKLPA